MTRSVTGDISDNAVGRAVAAMGDGGFVLVVDAEDRENEGDLILAAEAATPEAPSLVGITRHNAGYLQTKRTRLGHLLSLPLPREDRCASSSA